MNQSQHVLPVSLIQIVDAALASAVMRAEHHLACRPGCSQCCHGVFEITALDAQRLRAGLSTLEREDPGKANRIHSRLATARMQLAPFFPGNTATGVLNADEQAIELFEEWAHTNPCPILDPESQTCDLYAARPILCRTFGPPIRNDHEDPAAGLAICELCFTEASAQEIAAAEIDSSFRVLEDSLGLAYAAEHPGTGPTIIAFALSPQA